MKKLISLALTIVLLASLVSATTVNASIYDTKIKDGFVYEVLENKYAMITGVTEAKVYEIKDVLEIPEELDGYVVKYIGETFSIGFDAEYLKKVIIPDTVTYIGEYAFAFDSGDDYDDMISGIETIILPSNLTYIGENAFEYNTELKEIKIPDTVTYIGARAFRDCDSLEEVYIPGTVRVMGRSVFAGCDNLKKATIGEGIELIPEYTFESCTALKKVNLPDSLTWIEEYAFYNCTNLKSIKVNSYFSIGSKSLGYYRNKKGKEAYNKNFKIKVYEKNRNELDSPVHYANAENSDPVCYLDADAPKKLFCDVPQYVNKIKAKLKINGVEVKRGSSSNPKVATITSKGKLKTVGKGKTILTAKLKDGSTYKRKLKVNDYS